MKDFEIIVNELKEIEVKAINLIYKYNYTEIRSIKNEEVAYDLDIGLDNIDEVMGNLIHNKIIIKNGDRFSVNSDYVKKLISLGILDIDGVILHLSNKLFDANLNLNNLKSEIAIMKDEIKNEFSKMKEDLNTIKETYSNLKKVSNAKDEVQKLDNELKSSKISLIEFLGVFIAIFSLISINVSSLGIIKDLITFKQKILMILTINITIVIAVGMLLLFIKLMFKNLKK